MGATDGRPLVTRLADDGSIIGEKRDLARHQPSLAVAALPAPATFNTLNGLPVRDEFLLDRQGL
ncbi:hypothetical protein LCGC14_2364470, partial [marine sediment metagenome]